MEDQKQRVYDALNKMGIKYEVVEHEPVHTMEDMEKDCEKALQQIDKKMYAKDYDEIFCYWIAFVKKRCLVKRMISD